MNANHTATQSRDDMLRARSRRRRQRGGAVAELAVLLPLLAIILLGTVDFGRIMHDAVIVQGAARAGAYHGAQSAAAAADAPAIKNVVLDELKEFKDAHDVDVTSGTFCRCSDGTDVACSSRSCLIGSSKPWTYVRVTVATTFETLFSYPGIPNKIRVTRETQMRVLE
jgi:Flp pilus assembly protein TadG